MNCMTAAEMVEVLRRLNNGHYQRKYSAAVIAKEIGCVSPLTVWRWIAVSRTDADRRNGRGQRPNPAHVARIRAFLIRIGL